MHELQLSMLQLSSLHDTDVVQRNCKVQCNVELRILLNDTTLGISVLGFATPMQKVILTSWGVSLLLILTGMLLLPTLDSLGYPII